MQEHSRTRKRRHKDSVGESSIQQLGDEDEVTRHEISLARQTRQQAKASQQKTSQSKTSTREKTTPKKSARNEKVTHDETSVHAKQTPSKKRKQSGRNVSFLCKYGRQL